MRTSRRFDRSETLAKYGDLVTDKNADITLTRTTDVLTDSTGTHAIEYPNGNGQSVTCRLSLVKTRQIPDMARALVMVNTLTSNGAVDLKRGDDGCANIGLKQYKQARWLLY